MQSFGGGSLITGLSALMSLGTTLTAGEVTSFILRQQDPGFGWNATLGASHDISTQTGYSRQVLPVSNGNWAQARLSMSWANEAITNWQPMSVDYGNGLQITVEGETGYANNWLFIQGRPLITGMATGDRDRPSDNATRAGDDLDDWLFQLRTGVGVVGPQSRVSSRHATAAMGRRNLWRIDHGYGLARVFSRHARLCHGLADL